MPFFISIRPQQTEVKIPYTEYEKFDQAENEAKNVLNKYAGLYFVGVYFHDEETPARCISNLIQNGFSLYSWTQYKYFDKMNKIRDFFVLNGNHYIKLKPKK